MAESYGLSGYVNDSGDLAPSDFQAWTEDLCSGLRARAMEPPFRCRREKLDFERDYTRELARLALRAVQGNIDKPALCRAAVTALDNPPADPILALIAENLCQAAMDFAYFNKPISRLRVGLSGFFTACNLIEADEIINRLRRS